jgi:hypothetical protein
MVQADSRRCGLQSLLNRLVYLNSHSLSLTQLARGQWLPRAKQHDSSSDYDVQNNITAAVTTPWNVPTWYCPVAQLSYPHHSAQQYKSKFSEIRSLV